MLDIKIKKDMHHKLQQKTKIKKDIQIVGRSRAHRNDLRFYQEKAEEQIGCILFFVRSTEFKLNTKHTKKEKRTKKFSNWSIYGLTDI